MAFSSPALAQVYRFEAESGPLSGRHGVFVSSSASGYSGTGYITGFDNTGDYFEMDVSAPSGLHEMWVGYRVQTGFGDKGYRFRVGNEEGNGTLQESGTFSEDLAGLFNLAGGKPDAKPRVPKEYLTIATTPLEVDTADAPFDIKVPKPKGTR